MKLASRFPLSALVFITALYYSGIILFIEPISIRYKIFHIIVSFICVLLAYLFEISFIKEGKVVKEQIFSNFIDKSFESASIVKKIRILLGSSALLLLFSSIIEYVITIVFTPNRGLTFGFPLPIFSFSVERLLFLNLITDIVFFAIVIYLIGTVVDKEKPV